MKSIDVHTLQSWLDEDDVILIDVREPFEHKSKHIPKAHLVPINSIEKHNVDTLSGKKVVVHCKSGSRSSKAYQKLLEMVPEMDVYNLEGGFDAWEQAKLDINGSGNNKVVGIDRQVQITVGSLVLICSILSYLFSPLFLLLTGFFGAGLLFAGISGSCQMAVLLAKMPWNRVREEL